MPLELFMAILLQVKQFELNIEEFLELQPVLGLSEKLGIFWEMNIDQGRLKTYQTKFLNQSGRQRLKNMPFHKLKSRILKFENHFRVKKIAIQLL